MNLKAIERLMEFDPGYLDDPKCPYPTELKAYLRRLVGPVRAGRDDLASMIEPVLGDEDASSEKQVDSLLVEVGKALDAMRTLQAEMQLPDTSTSDRVMFFKNYGSMMERFISLKEKAQGVKQMYEFQREVMEVLSNVLSKDQIYDFKQRLKALDVEVPETESQVA